METYVGTKIVQGEPMVKDGVQGFKVVYPPFKAGDKPYTSWSPHDVFVNAYRKITESEKELI